MERQRRAPSNQGYSQQYASTTPDPFGGDFSQERVTQASRGWPILQWHGGIANLVGDGDTMKINGGFFMEDERILDLGLDPNYPAPGFERISLRLGGNQVPGWGASMLHIAFIFTNFSWEDRETGRNRFPPEEYDRRKQQNLGAERELRGRTRALVAVRELMGQGVVEPVLLSIRGTYSASVNAILRDVRRIADEATRLRRSAGYDGSIPREAFWIPIYAGAMEDVGEGTATSRVSRPKADVPPALTRDILIQYLVEPEHRRAGGTFDEWANIYGEMWDEKMAFTEEEVQVQAQVQQEVIPNQGYTQYQEQEQDNYYG